MPRAPFPTAKLCKCCQVEGPQHRSIAALCAPRSVRDSRRSQTVAARLLLLLLAKHVALAGCWQRREGRKLA